MTRSGFAAMLVCLSQPVVADAAGPEIRRIWMERSRVPGGYQESNGKREVMTTYRLWLDVLDEAGRKPGPDEVLVTVAERKADGTWGGDMRLASFCYRDPDDKPDCSKSYFSLSHGYLARDLQRCVTLAVRAKARQEPNTAVRDAEFRFGSCGGAPGDVVSGVTKQTTLADPSPPSAPGAHAHAGNSGSAPSRPAGEGRPHLTVAGAKVAFATARAGGGFDHPVIELTVTVKNVGEGVAVLRDDERSVHIQLHVNGVNVGRTTVLEPGAASQRTRLSPGDSVERRWIYADAGALHGGDNTFLLQVDGSDDKLALSYRAEPCREIDVEPTSGRSGGIALYGGTLRNECRGDALNRYWCLADFVVGAGVQDCPAGCQGDRCLEPEQKGAAASFQAGAFREGEQVPAFRVRVVGGTDFESRMPRDEATLLVFFGRGCATCESTLQFARALSAGYGLRGLMVLGIQASSSEAGSVARFAESRRLDFPMGYACPEKDCLKLASGVPAMVLVDPGGKVVMAADRRRLTSQPGVFRELLSRVRRVLEIAQSEPIPPAIRSHLDIGRATEAVGPAAAGTTSPAQLLAAVKAELEAGHYRRGTNDLFEKRGVGLSTELRDPATAPLAAALLEEAGDFVFARDLRKRYPATRPPDLPPPVRVAAGRRAFVQSSVLNLRRAPRPDAPVVSRLYLDTPVDVVAIEGEWARVRWRGPARASRGAVLGLFGAHARAGAASFATPAANAPVEGYVAAGFLAGAPVDRAALEADAKAAIAGGDRDQAVALLERLVALDPGDRNALRRLLDAAIDADRPTAAAHAAMMLAGPAAPLAAGLEVEQIDVAWGCRGDLARAVFVGPRATELEVDRLPANVCIENVDSWGPCSSCEPPSEEGSRDSPERKREERERRQHQRRRARLDALFPAEPFVHVLLRNRSAIAPLAATRLFAYTAHAIGGCDELGGAGQPMGIELAALEIPDLEPLEAFDLWIAVPEYAGRHYGLLAATRGEPELREALRQLQWGDPRAIRGIAVDGMPPRRGLETPGDPCCCD